MRLQFLHRKFRTKITVLYDIDKNEYIVYFLDDLGNDRTYFLTSLKRYINLMEKITIVKRRILLKNVKRIPTVDMVKKYGKKHGYIISENIFNIALRNNYYLTFMGKKPDNYQKPEELISFLQNALCEDYSYFVSSLKYMYEKFEISQIITCLFCKNTAICKTIIDIACSGFSNNVLITDLKHFKKEIETIKSDNLIVYDKNNLVNYVELALNNNDVNKKVFLTSCEWKKIHPNDQYLNNLHIIDINENAIDTFQTTDRNKLFKEILNFYYWLGNEYNSEMTREEYTSTRVTHKSKSFITYIMNVDKKAKISFDLLKTFTYKNYLRFLQLHNLSENDIEYDYKRGVYKVNASELRMKTDVSYIITKLININNFKRHPFRSGKYYYLNFTNYNKNAIREIEAEKKAAYVMRKRAADISKTQDKMEFKISKDELEAVLRCCGYSYISINKILKGERNPSLQKAIEIEKKYGIPVLIWDNWKGVKH